MRSSFFFHIRGLVISQTLFACHSIFSIMKIYNSGEEIRIMNRKIMDLIVKIILTILAVVAGILTFTLQWPGRSAILAPTYGILYFVAAVTFWLENKKIWARVIMIAALVVTMILTIAQSIAGIPLGIFQGNGVIFSGLIVLFSAPAILGLIYFNLDAHHSTLDLLMVFMRIILNFEVGIIAVILIVMLEVSGEAIWSLPLWGQYILVYSIMLLAILDIVYAIINWFNFYRGKLAWITTILMAIEIAICLPLFGMPSVSSIIFTLIAIVILVFTIYLNNRIKNKK